MYRIYSQHAPKLVYSLVLLASVMLPVHGSIEAHSMLQRTDGYEKYCVIAYI